MEVKIFEVISQVEEELMVAFEMVDMGSISFYLGLKISWDCEKKTIKLSQPVYINKILAKFHLSQANISNTPMKKSWLKPNKKKPLPPNKNIIKKWQAQ